jgi:hypothetical protein
MPSSPKHIQARCRFTRSQRLSAWPDPSLHPTCYRGFVPFRRRANSNALGSDPVALLVYDRSGYSSAQFMKRDRSSILPDGPASATNNTQAQGGYDAYFGTCAVNDATVVVTQQLLGALSGAA